MIYVKNLNLWIIVLIISQVSAVSYNQPKFYSNTTWNPNATTFADNTTIGQYPFDIFINTNNTIYVPNQQNGQIIIWSQENNTLITNNSITTSSNLSNPYSLFVTVSGDIYVDTFNSMGEVSKWTSNLTSGTLTMRTCQNCWDLFVDMNNMLYCSLGERHQIIAKSLNYTTNTFMIVAGTGSADTALNTLNNPRGIFVDINFDLYVADCGNDRIQLFHSGKLTGMTVAGNRSSNITITLNCPTGIILDADQYLFIVDHNNHRIVRSGSNGFQCLVGCSETSGSASYQLNGPWSLSFDSHGNIFVTDQGNSRIQKFILSTNSSDTVATAIATTVIINVTTATSTTITTTKTTATTTTVTITTTTMATTTATTTVTTTTITTTTTTVTTTTTTSTSTTATTTTTVTTTTTTSTSTTATTTTTVTTTTTITTVPILPSQCSSYTTITDGTRNVNYTGSRVCDNIYFSNSTTTWVGFSGAAGTQIPTSVVAISHCSTDAPGYYTGVMPSVGVTVTGIVCYNWAGNTCNWNNSISVTNCNSYYVYALIAPQYCYLRYCTV